MTGLSHLFRGHLLQWLLRGLGVIVLGALFYRYLVHDGDFDVYWAATFRFLHGLKVHIYEQNVFTRYTYTSRTFSHIPPSLPFCCYRFIHWAIPWARFFFLS